MTIDGTPINTNSREYIELMKELERDAEDAEIFDATHPSVEIQTVQSWPATPESAFTALDALLAPEEIGIHWGVPFVHRPERADEPAAVAVGVALMVRQAV